MSSLIRQAKSSLLSFLYPSCCLHCQQIPEEIESLFCHSCMTLLEMIDPHERCPTCFSEGYSPAMRECEECCKEDPVLDRLVGVFDYQGPASSLIKALKYGGRSELAQGAAAYLAAQFVKLDTPFPDVIVPVPIAWNHWLVRGFNQSLLLATELAKLLKCPVKDILYRHSGDFSQAGLTSLQRRQMKRDRIRLKKEIELSGKTILLVDDVMTTGSTLRRCAEVLIEQKPSQVIGIVLCRAV